MLVLDMLAALMISVTGMIYPIVTRRMLNDYIPNRLYKTILIAGIVVLVLYIIITIIRNIIEPKMVGTSLDLHPLATLITMIVGARMFSAVGMFGFPLALSFFQMRKKKQVQ